MKIKDKKKQTYDRYRYLLEYQVKKRPIEEENISNEDSSSDSDIFNELGSILDDKKPNTNINNNETDSIITDEPIENNTDIDVNTDDNTNFENTATDLLKIHASKIEKLTKYINDSVNILKTLRT